jgi:electron transfer flavoprotein alpha subunit
MDAQVAALEKLCQQSSPAVVLVGKTDIGRDVGPRLAYRLGVAVAQDCTAIGVGDGGRIEATRPVYGGNALAKVVFGAGDPQVVTVRPKAIEPLQPDAGRSGDVETVDAALDASAVKVKVLESVQEETQGVRLEDANVVIGGGRGLGGPEPFNTLDELANLLGGAVGASRAACDAGWLDHSHQIGLTGKSIAPDVYITIGISGASQHMAGCSGVKNLVAINRDEEANIFKEATLGVVGDWSKIVPAFLETVKELKAS